MQQRSKPDGGFRDLLYDLYFGSCFPLCGRFTLRTPASEWAQLFLPEMQLDLAELQQPPRYNIAPTQSVPCVLREQTGAPRDIQKLRWGLIPKWADDRSIGNRMINARGETVETKPSFRQAFRSRRCLVPADGFYEWKKVDGGKQPYLIEPAEGGVMALAGLWEENQKVAEGGRPVRSFTIITTEANALMSRLHDRMPVILEAKDFDRWLDPAYQDLTSLKAMLAPADDESLRMMPVSKHVNSPKNDDPRCIEPVAADWTRGWK